MTNHHDEQRPSCRLHPPKTSHVFSGDLGEGKPSRGRILSSLSRRRLRGTSGTSRVLLTSTHLPRRVQGWWWGLIDYKQVHLHPCLGAFSLAGDLQKKLLPPRSMVKSHIPVEVCGFSHTQLTIRRPGSENFHAAWHKILWLTTAVSCPVPDGNAKQLVTAALLLQHWLCRREAAGVGGRKPHPAPSTQSGRVVRKALWASW